MSDEFRLLSYDEIAEIFGIERESARQLVLRKRWTRTKGNDGRARIEVPLDVLPADTSMSTSDITSEDTSEAPSEDSGGLFKVTRALNRHIERLEEALDTAEKSAVIREIERDAARNEARAAERAALEARQAEALALAEVQSLKAMLEVERRHIEEAKVERDQWKGEATKSFWRRLVG